ncbi:ATP-binding protein [Micromonospora sp. NPDC050417]|uniref:ATP-binding protein n=1 Tax=Micromonospora sp. NPDC050417 TaxID=3364280 RepID=UPI0037A962EE
MDSGGVRGGTLVTTGIAERSWCVVVPHEASGARTARLRLATELAGVIPAELLADVVAVLAELVGNAVRHADPLPGGVIRVAWRLRNGSGADVVGIRVTDGGAATSPRVRPLGLDADDGRGLHIVTALATEWGVERDGLGQSVWAELAVPADHRLVTLH